VQVVSAKVKRTRQEYVNETIKSEWDVVQAIVKCIKQLGTVDLRHVKGHQTEKSADQPLPLSAKLNNEADAIATAFQEHTNHRDDLVLPIAGSQACLHADAVFPIKILDGAGDNFLPRRSPETLPPLSSRPPARTLYCLPSLPSAPPSGTCHYGGVLIPTRHPVISATRHLAVSPHHSFHTTHFTPHTH
jgi:hypothetical protein